MTDDEPQDPGEAASRELSEKRRTFPVGPDPDGPRVVGWEQMPEPARAAACLIALRQRWDLERGWMRWDPVTRAVFVVRPDPDVRDRRKCAVGLATTTEDAMRRVRATFGHRDQEVQRLLRQRWHG